jgi:curved DNA-binding protein CbpA
MKFAQFSIGLLACLSPFVAAWSKEDREIFRIRDEIAAHETNAESNFYDILGVARSASQDEITKAYKLKSRSLHPDKVTQQLRAKRAKDNKNAGNAAKPPSQAEIKKAVKKASDRQARLGLIAEILRGPGRERYDHYLSNGFPLWKGTDYYYNRYRPGLGTVLTGLFLIGGGAIHYLILYMNWKRQKEFVHRYVKFAREKAWGGSFSVPIAEAAPSPAPTPAAENNSGGDDSEPPMPMNRRQRRMQEKETKKEGPSRSTSKKVRRAPSQAQTQTQSSTPSVSTGGPTGARKRVVAENGKILVVDSLGDVYLEDEDAEGNVNEFLLDPEEIAQPTFRDTAVVQAPFWFYRITVGRFLGSKAEDEALDYDELVDEADSDIAQATPSTDSAGEDFEMLDKSTDSLGKAKATGAQQGGKPNRRNKNKKR